MNWDDIRFFLAVARSGQILAAAKMLNVNHTTVARRLNALEQHLNTRLVIRRTTGTVLTPAGEALLLRAEHIEAQILQIQANIGNQDIALSGNVRIAAPDGFAVAFLAQHLRDLAMKFPALTVQLISLSRPSSLSQREADIAITVERPRRGRLVTRKLVDYTLGLYAHEAYLAQHGIPSGIEDLIHHHLIGCVEDLIASPALAYTEEISRNWHANFQLSGTLGQAAAIRAQAGIGVLHGFIARSYPELVHLLSDIAIKRSYWLSYHESLRGLRRIHAVIEFIAQRVDAQRDIFFP